MAKSKPKPAAPRAISPKPAHLSGIGKSPKSTPGKQEAITPASVEEGFRSARGREREATEPVGLRPPPRSGSANISPSPTRYRPPRPLSTITPAVTVEPPQSPPKGKILNLSLGNNSSTYLSTELHTPVTSSSGTSSPRHFRIPSRPHTPIFEPGKSPSLPPSRPPSPPPPRRSGELKRDPSKAAPPPINRSEKPKIASKPTTLKLEPASASIRDEKSSPFHTPPGSDESPEQELPPPALPPNRPRNSMIISSTPRSFEPPPVHHMVVSKWRDQESHGLGRAMSISRSETEQPPALPTRPQIVPESSKPRQVTQNTMMPPPPKRASMDRNRPPIAATDNNHSTPPKRVFSTPTSQVQTPPRHGRSMTVDRISERTPTEFRAPLTGLSSKSSGRTSLDVQPTASYIKETLSQVGQISSDYPDPSYSNRRPPQFKQGAREIPTKYDTRIFDVCGEFVCTSGLLTRVWSLLDGELVMSLAHTEGVKIISVVFKPASDVEAEGSKLWLGNNIGDILEVDVASQSIVASKASAHTRREVIKMHRHKNEIWTLDDGGTLHLWAADSTGEITLSNPYQSFRVPKGHTFSMVVGDELWHAAGKDIRVFVPSTDANVQFQILQRPICQTTAGEVTSGTIISTQPDRVYFGHVDGKVSIYSRSDYTLLGIFNISVYKITSIVGIGGKLWAGFSTGMIYVYDTSVTPWLVQKEWKAHSDPLTGMIADRGSFWSLDRAQVISLGQDNNLRIWDGLLQEDWIGNYNFLTDFFFANNLAENYMHSQEVNFCELNPMKTLVMTWNAGASTPYHLQHSEKDSRFFRDFLQSSGSPDIIIFGFQELVDLEDKKTTASKFHLDPIL